MVTDSIASEVLAAARSRAAALAAGDPDRLRTLLHRDFRWSAHTGEQLDRDRYVESNTGGRTRWSAQHLGDPEVVVVGDTAVLRTVVTDVVDTDAGPRAFRMPMTQVWVRDGDGWRCLAGHAGPRLDVEPDAGPWRPVADDELVGLVRDRLPDGRALVLVDGRSGSGKSTFASRLAGMLGAAVVRTDDVAWHLHPTDWAAALAEGVLAPWRRGEAVSYRPPGWVAKGRPGSVEVPACEVLVVEGVGAGRASLAATADLVVWVQSDRDEARRRGLARDVELGRTRAEAEAFWDDWMRSEEPFLAEEQPWTRAHLVVTGTPPVDGADDGRTWVADGPATTVRAGR
jgi:hypothetical protein